MAKIPKKFTVTKHLPKKYGCIEFTGIVYYNDPEHYDIESVIFHTPDTRNNTIHSEYITSFFHMHRNLNDPQFHHEDIVCLLTELLLSDNLQIAA